MPRGHVEYVRADVPAATPVLVSGEALGLLGAVLSHDSSTGASTSLLTAGPWWRADASRAFDREVEILMLSGAMNIAGLSIETGDYVYLPAGTGLGDWSTTTGASMLWMPAGDLRSAPAARIDDAVLRRTWQMPWLLPPSFEGRTAEETVSGLSVKFLREVGDGPYTLLARHAPGWADLRQETHDTWEELLLLEGDYLMGTTGAVEAGTYIFRPGIRPHGPQATRAGAVWFCRGERRIDFRFTEPEWAGEHVRGYLAEAHPRERKAPWGHWF